MHNPTPQEAISNSVTHQYLDTLAEQGFWGFLTLKFENGHIVHLRREENMKPNNLPEIIRRSPQCPTNNNHR